MPTVETRPYAGKASFKAGLFDMSRYEVVHVDPLDRQLQMPTVQSDAKPMKMIMKQAIGAGREANRIWEQGLGDWKDVFVNGAELPTLPLDREITFQEAVRHSFAFMELWGKKAQGDTIASITMGLPWDRIRDYKKCAALMLPHIAQEDIVKVKKYGDHKVLAFIETDIDPEEMLRRFIEAPDVGYKEEFGGNMRNAVGFMQRLRKRRILGSRDDGYRPFIDVFNGNVEGLTRAYKDNKECFFEWPWEERADGRQWGLNLDFGQQALDDLASRATVAETGELLSDVDAFMKGKKKKHRYVVQIDNGEDVSCCNIAFNAQQGLENVVPSNEIEDPLVIVGGRVYLRDGVRDTEKKTCPKHNTDPNECGCQTTQELSASAK